MPKFVIAPDSFKECLSSGEAAEAIERGIRSACPRAETVVLPVADGGEGTLEAITRPSERVFRTVTGPYGAPVRACYGMRGKTAVVEMATAAGLTLAPAKERRAAAATTYGVGELIRHAMEQGAEKVLLTAGGSATNDGGCGMAAALGVVFTRPDGSAFLPTGGTLAEIGAIDVKNSIFAHTHCKFTVATDVRNPLLGEHGATRMFGRQKGADEADLDAMEAGMAHCAGLWDRICGKRVELVPGAGAGGGIAVPLLAIAGAEIVSGIEAVLSAVGFADAVRGADAVLTGEGKTARPRLFGKTVGGVVRAAGAVPVVAFSGCLGDAEEDLLPLGLQKIVTVRSLASSDEDSIRNAARYLEMLGERFAKEWIERGRMSV